MPTYTCDPSHRGDPSKAHFSSSGSVRQSSLPSAGGLEKVISGGGAWGSSCCHFRTPTSSLPLATRDRSVEPANVGQSELAAGAGQLGIESSSEASRSA